MTDRPKTPRDLVLQTKKHFLAAASHFEHRAKQARRPDLIAQYSAAARQCREYAKLGEEVPAILPKLPAPSM
jgi:hypothetical protein